MAGNIDYSKLYNSPLSSMQEDDYLKWIQEISKNRGGRNALSDMVDYDIQGAFLSGIPANGGHFPDTYKKPNHPTFSDQSQYSQGPMIGGSWGETIPVGQWNYQDTFTPTTVNKNMFSLEDLQRYFARAEPNAMLRYK